MKMELNCTIADAQAITNAYNALARYELPCATAIAFNVKRIVDKVQEIEQQRLDILSQDASVDEDGKPLYRLYWLESNAPVVENNEPVNDLNAITVSDNQYVGYAFDTDEVRERNDRAVRELLETVHTFGSLRVISTADLQTITMPAQLLFPLMSYGLVIEQEHNG